MVTYHSYQGTSLPNISECELSSEINLRPPGQLDLKLHLVSRLLQQLSPNLDEDPTAVRSVRLKMTSEVSTATLLTSKENLPCAGRPTENGIKHETTGLQGQLEISTWISPRKKKWMKWMNKSNLPLILHCNLHCCCTTTPEFWKQGIAVEGFWTFRNEAPQKHEVPTSTCPTATCTLQRLASKRLSLSSSIVKICTVGRLRRLGLAPRDHPEALQKRILLQWCQRPLTHESTNTFSFLVM